MQPYGDHFSPLAAEYRASRPAYPDELVDRLVEISGRNGVAWDAGCGSGQLSIPLARGFETVIASDASADQVAAAPAHPRVRYRVARAEASGLPAGVVDLAVAAQAAHWFDLPAYYAEVERVGRAGGSVVLICYGRPVLPAGPDALLERFHGHVLAPYWPPERRHVEQGYRSLPFPFREIPSPALAMTHRWDLRRFRGYVETWSGVRSLLRRAGPTPLREFFRELALAWGDPADRHHVRWPIRLRAGRLPGA